MFCFTGSGNSYWVAKEIGAAFSIQPELITSFKEITAIEIADSQVGIIAPVYLNDIPKAVKEFILKLYCVNNKAYVFTVLTSSSGKNTNGFKNVNIALAQHNAKLALAYDISMPSSFQERADMTSVLYAVPGKIKEIVKMIGEKRENYTQKGSTALPKNYTKLSFLYRNLLRMNVTEKCEGCGLCCHLCPANNIHLQGGKAMVGKSCIACTACANWCPHYAIRCRLLKDQYHHPGVSADELIPIKK